MLATFFRTPPAPLPTEIDWHSLIAEAAREYLLPALADQCRKLGIEANLPPEIANVLTTAESLNAERNQAILTEAAHVATLLNQIGIQPVALKGLAYLLAGVYPNPATRYLQDIDLLLPAHQIQPAVTHLQANQYFQNEPGLLLQFRHHHPALRRPGQPQIELHHRLGQGICNQLLPAQTLLRTIDVHVCRLASRPSPSFLLPSPTSLTNHLILHSQLAHSYQDRISPPLRSLIDLSHLQTRYPSQINWQSLAQTYKSNHQSATLTLHLHQAKQILGLPIPSPIPQNLTPLLSARYKRRTLLTTHPALRLADPTYLYMSLLSRRLRILPQVLTHPTSWPEALQSLRNIKLG